METSREMQNTYAVAFETSKQGGGSHLTAHIAGLAAVAARAEYDYHSTHDQHCRRAVIEALAQEAEDRYPFGAMRDDRESTVESVAGWLRSLERMGPRLIKEREP